MRKSIFVLPLAERCSDNQASAAPGMSVAIFRETRRDLHGRPQFAKHSLHDIKKVTIAAMHPDFLWGLRLCP
jgi:hypothetical protein